MTDLNKYIYTHMGCWQQTLRLIGKLICTKSSCTLAASEITRLYQGQLDLSCKSLLVGNCSRLYLNKHLLRKISRGPCLYPRAALQTDVLRAQLTTRTTSIRSALHRLSHPSMQYLYKSWQHPKLGAPYFAFEQAPAFYLCTAVVQ